MRDYLHKVHEPLIVAMFDDLQNYGARDVWVQLEKGVDVRYATSTALSAFVEGMQTSWALEDGAAQAHMQAKLSALVRLMLEQFSVDEVQLWIAEHEFAWTGLVDDAVVLRDLAVLLQGRAHEYREGLSGAAVSHMVLDALTALVRGDDVLARESLAAARVLYASPQTPPASSESWLAPIDAVLDGDDAALTAAVVAEEQRWAKAHAPTRDRHAGPEALVHGHLTLICRVAAWRGMTPPTSCYIIPFDDD